MENVRLSRPIAVRIRVRDLSQTAKAFARRGVTHAWSEHGLSVAPIAPLGCAFAFSE